MEEKTQNENELMKEEMKQRKKRKYVYMLVSSFVLMLLSRILIYIRLIDKRNIVRNLPYTDIVCLLMPIVFFILAVITGVVYRKKLIFIFMGLLAIFTNFWIPYKAVVREVYLKYHIEDYNSAVEYVLKYDNGEAEQKVIMPERYKFMTYQVSNDINFAYILKDEDTTRVFFEVITFFSTTGYCYVINERKDSEEREIHTSFFLKPKQELEGTWTWTLISNEKLVRSSKMPFNNASEFENESQED